MLKDENKQVVQITIANKIEQIVRESISPINTTGKTGKSVLQPTIGAALQKAGFKIDFEDQWFFLDKGLPVWRSKDTNDVVPTKLRRKIDIVAYLDGKPAALIETESDLNDLRANGSVSGRSGHYDVFSIARSGEGNWFHSYKSLERMAAAAYFHHFKTSPTYSKTTEQEVNNTAVGMLEQIESNEPSAHNPSALPMFLVSGSGRSSDMYILKDRLSSLGAKLICGSIR